MTSGRAGGLLAGDGCGGVAETTAVISGCAGGGDYVGAGFGGCCTYMLGKVWGVLSLPARDDSPTILRLFFQ